MLKHICGDIIAIKRPTDILSGATTLMCPKCSKRKTHFTKMMMLDSLKAKIRDHFGDEYAHMSGFRNAHSRIMLKHSCGRSFEIEINRLFDEKRFAGCPYCRKNKRGTYQTDPDYLENSLKERCDGDEYEWLEEFRVYAASINFQ